MSIINPDFWHPKQPNERSSIRFSCSDIELQVSFDAGRFRKNFHSLDRV